MGYGNNMQNNLLYHREESNGLDSQTRTASSSTGHESQQKYDNKWA